MVAVSVIVPTHNSIKYIQECMDSILRQTLKDIEIICIDSSVDGTTEILYNYQKNDKRVKVVIDENSSYGYKLNLGIRYAKGSYVAIVESDDFIADNMLEGLYEATVKGKLDFVKANYEGFIDTKYKRVFCHSERVEEKHYNRIIDLKRETEMKPFVGYNIWTGIYKTDFLKRKGICFHESKGASYQDIGFSCLVAMMAGKICFLKECYYKYRMDNDCSSVKSDEKYKCISLEFSWLKCQMKKLGCDIEVNNSLYEISKLTSYYWNYTRLSKKYQRKFLEHTINIECFYENKSCCHMPIEEHIMKIFRGDINSIEKEEERKKDRINCYKYLWNIFHNFNSIVLVCYGMYGQAVHRFMDLTESSASITICDNYLKEKGMEIIDVETAVETNPESFYIIANKRHGEEIKYQIENLGINKKNIYICNNIAIGIDLLEEFGRYRKYLVTAQ